MFAPFNDARVQATFESLPRTLYAPLMRLRQYVFDTAAETAGIDDLIETLKWRKPAYLPKKPRTGATIRINALKGSHDRYAMYVHCQTSLIETFKSIYPDAFFFEGNRALLFDVKDPIPEQPLKHCIAMALTYHIRANA
ncbi:MAG: DUF1801 domain-containing protein [Beijerinckiaceae bacterium]